MLTIISRPSILLFLLLIFVQKINAQVDTVPPVLLCKPFVTIAIHPTCYIIVNAEPFIDTVYDDSQIIDLAVRKQCVGSGFPKTSQISFSANDLGSQIVEIWARDHAGNIASCTVNVFVGDFGSCDPSFTLYFGTALQAGIDSVFVDIRGSNCKLDSFNHSIFAFTPHWQSPLFQGYYSEFSSISPASGYDFEIIPYKNEKPLNGITEEDLNIIKAYMLGHDVLDSTYKIIAADANQDGKVNILDVILLRKLMIGIINDLPNGKSWRFLPDNYVFPNPQHPFITPFPEKISISNIDDPVPSHHTFTGVKIGDVNFSADPN